MDAQFVRRSAVLGRILPALALFWPTVPGAEVRATWPLDNGAHDDTDPAGPVPQTREQAPSVPLPGLDLDALAGGRLLDLSLRDHFSTGETTLVLLGSEATFLYELT